MFYLDLKKKREELGLSLDQVSERTKINKKYLEAFENGDFTILPETYIRLFLRTYAKELGIEPDKIIEDYDSYKSQKSESEQIPKKKKPTKRIEVEKPSKKEKEKKSGIDIPTTVIVILMVIFIITIIKQVVEDRKKGHLKATNTTQTIPAGKQPKKADTTAAKRSVTIPIDTQRTIDTSKAILQTEVPQIDSFSVRIIVTDTCWIEITKDDNLPYDYIYYPGNTRTLYAKKTITLRIGKPAGVKVYFNETDLGKLGENGIPIKLTLTKDGVIEKQSYR